jgi:hypothetical protein
MVIASIILPKSGDLPSHIAEKAIALQKPTAKKGSGTFLENIAIAAQANLAKQLAEQEKQ